MQHFQATIPAGHNKPTVLTDGPLLHLWQLHTCLFKPPARSCPQARPLCSHTNATEAPTHTGTGSRRGQEQGVQDRTSFCSSARLCKAENGQVQFWYHCGSAVEGAWCCLPMKIKKNLEKITQKTVEGQGEATHTPHIPIPKCRDRLSSLSCCGTTPKPLDCSPGQGSQSTASFL